MLVYVINKNGNPLMPCRPSKARKLLRDGKAKVIRKEPFTIKLLWDCIEFVQELTVAIDSGSKYIGSAVRDEDNNVYYMSQVEVRQDVTTKMKQRKMYRRNRRSRKTRYRKARFLNRKNSIKKDRYSPTLSYKYDLHIREITYTSRILPVKKCIIETGNFDIHAMHNPEVLKHPWLYQKGVKLGFYNTKAYILYRDGYTCQYCNNKRKDSRLHVHHVIYVSNGGSDRPNNLLTLCILCHDDLHAGLLTLTKKNVKNLNLKHATHMNVLSSMFRKRITFQETFGYITKAVREYFKVAKSHYNDAICIGLTNPKFPTLKTDKVIFKKSIPKGVYQIFHGSRSEKRYPKGKIQGFNRWDKVLYKGEKCFIKGRMSTGYAILCDIFNTKLNFKPIPKFPLLTKLSAAKSWIMIEQNVPSS